MIDENSKFFQQAAFLIDYIVIMKINPQHNIVADTLPFNMEVVIATSILAHAGSLAIDRFAPKFDAALSRSRETNQPQTPVTQSEPQPEPQPQPQASPVLERENAENSPQQQSSNSCSQPEPVEEGSVEFLQQRLKQLRNDAKKLNAPDTLVQYARVTREANKVEKALNEKKAEQGLSATSSMGIDAMTSALAEMMKPGAGVVRQGVTSQMLRMIPRIISFIFLWYYFSFQDTSTGKGIAMAVDCQALRPISFLFRKLPPTCFDDDWVCAAQTSQSPMCAISYSWAFILCNVVISVLLQA